MCGRYTLFRLEQLLGLFPWLTLPPGVEPRYNIAPSQPILAVGNEAPTQLDYFYWGLIPSWAKDRSIGNRMINARAETLAEKPAFRTALQRRRCLIPADGFFEWRKEPDGTKTPIYLQNTTEEPFMFAGLWDRWHDPDGSEIRSCTIITTSPNALMKTIHDRMPVMLRNEDCQKWLKGPDPASVLHPYPEGAMKATAVSTQVNNPRNESKKCVEPVDEQRLL